MDKRIKEVVLEDTQKITALTKEAAYSGAYLFPLQVSLEPKPLTKHTSLTKD